MVDTHEDCWVLDFGLAAYRAARDGDVNQGGHGESIDGAASGIMGTPRYMAPEQFQERADARTDVWGLGVTLYELLTLRPAFTSRVQIPSSEPGRPREFVGNLPRDLEAICIKALRKDPRQRYATAREFSDDLRRWLAHEPVRARRARTMRRVGLWAKRNKGWAAAITVATLSVLALACSAVSISRVRANQARAETRASKAETAHVNAQLVLVKEHEQALQREKDLVAFHRLRTSPHANGWFDEVWTKVRALRGPIFDRQLQAQAAASLEGVDARRIKSLPFPGTRLAFDPTGRRIMISGSSLIMRGPEQPIRSWDSTTDHLQATEIHGDAAAFGFRPDGTPLLVMVPKNEPSAVQLWDRGKGQVLRTFRSPVESKSKIRAWALTPDGKSVAASAGALNEKGEPVDTSAVAVWDTATGREFFRTTAQHATNVALAPDSSLLAAGYEDGHITVWSLPRGEQVASLKADRNRINCLVFGRDPVRRSGPKPSGSGWLLASGDQGGGVTIWDLRLKIPRSICHGPSSSQEVLAVTFSPDGMTLASAGRGFVQLWDIASGQFLLNVVAGNYATALAFSPDGRQLAVGSIAAFGDSDSVMIWELEAGRGIDNLRGLLGAVFKSTLSSDGRLVAALSNDRHVGIWDRAAYRLLHVLEVTPGLHFDNAGFAFSPDGHQLAFASGREASLWDVGTGEPIKTWNLPAGLVDRLAFPEPKHLLLFREETDTGGVESSSAFDPSKYPRVCRVRNLLGPQPLNPLAEIRDCNLHVFGSECSPDGKYYVIEGLGGSPGKVKRIANMYEGPTGKRLGALPTENLINRDGALHRFDPTGTLLCFESLGKRDQYLLLEMPSRAVLRQLDQFPSCLGPKANRWLISSGATADQPAALTLLERDRKEPLIKFLLDLGGAGLPRFSSDGLHLIWGNPSGAVTVVDLVEVHRRLASVGLGW
jgi:WD40 repeat protein